MNYILGVDGGNTKTHYALFDSNGTLVAFQKGGTASHERMADGYEGAAKELKKNIDILLRTVNADVADIKNAVFGVAGVDIPKQKELLSETIKRMGLSRFTVLNDAYLGIMAGSKSGYGVCSNIGTGTSCVGMDRKGRQLQIGGYGYLSNDEAVGGSCLGKMAAKAVYDSIYRCGLPTLIKDMLFEKIKISKEIDFVERLYELGYPAKRMDEYAQIVFRAANQNDQAAQNILKKMGTDTAMSVLGMIKKLDFFEDEEIEVIMSGSVFVKGENPTLIDTFKKEITRFSSQKIKFLLLNAAPVSGAVILAHRELYGHKSKIKDKIIKEIKKVRSQ